MVMEMEMARRVEALEDASVLPKMGFRGHARGELRSVGRDGVIRTRASWDDVAMINVEADLSNLVVTAV